MKIAIVGPGAIGGTVAAWLGSTEDHELVVCARTPFERLCVETPAGNVEIRPTLLSRVEDARPVDWVIVATKTYEVEGTARWLDALRRPETPVAVFQNGVEHVERFRDHVPERAIVPVVIDCPAERVRPGVMRQRGHASMVVPENEDGRVLASFFAHAPVSVSLTRDLKSAAWRKLCLNTAGVVPAILGQGDGVSRHEPIADLMRDLVREAIAVGRAEGAQLEDSIVEDVVQACRRAPVDAVNSLNADRRAGRQTEIDARNGAIVRLGRRHGIATPFNSMAVALMSV